MNIKEAREYSDRAESEERSARMKENKEIRHSLNREWNRYFQAWRKISEGCSK